MHDSEEWETVEVIPSYDDSFVVLISGRTSVRRSHGQEAIRARWHTHQGEILAEVRNGEFDLVPCNGVYNPTDWNRAYLDTNRLQQDQLIVAVPCDRARGFVLAKESCGTTIGYFYHIDILQRVFAREDIEPCLLENRQHFFSDKILLWQNIHYILYGPGCNLVWEEVPSREVRLKNYESRKYDSASDKNAGLKLTSIVTTLHRSTLNDTLNEPTYRSRGCALVPNGVELGAASSDTSCSDVFGNDILVFALLDHRQHGPTLTILSFDDSIDLESIGKSGLECVQSVTPIKTIQEWTEKKKVRHRDQ